MNIKLKIAILVWGMVLASAVWAAVPKDAPKDASAIPASPVAHTPQEADYMRVEGEKRYHANCGRCHAAPQKFPPRMMATIVRHMRVRAMITDQDMKLVLFYMTQ